MTRHLFVAILALSLAAPPARAQNRRAPDLQHESADVAELWTDPVDLPSRDFFNGPWGVDHAPAASAIYTFVGSTRGANSGMTVRDPAGRQWTVKQPASIDRAAEGPVEVVLSRVLSGVGFHQPPVYYLPSYLLTRGGATERLIGGRFRLSLKDLKERGEWSWTKNPFARTRELKGLLVLLLMFNSADLKDASNALYAYTPSGAEPWQRWFVVRDLGTALGSTARGARAPGNLDAFEDLGFISYVENDYVVFAYDGPHRRLFDRQVTPEDVVWAARLLARVSNTQWADAFRAGGFAPPASSRFIATLKGKIEEGLALEHLTGRD